MPQLTLETIMERPQWTRFQSSNGLAAAAKLAYTYNKEVDEDGWLSLPNAAFKKLLGPNWKKWLEKSQADGCAFAEIGDEQTRWQPRARFLTETDAVEPAASLPQPRPRYPSDDRPRRTSVRNDSTTTPQPAPPVSFAEQTDTPQPSDSETDSETKDIYKNKVSESVSESARNAPHRTPQNGNGSHKANIEAWRAMNECLARDSVEVLGDNCDSLGLHIRFWNHARKMDKENGNDALFQEMQMILLQLQQLCEHTGESQGAAWFASVTGMFDAKGYPMSGKMSMSEAAAVRSAILADNPDFATREGGSP